MAEPTRPPSPFPLPIIIDTDPGIDDMLALFLALGSPELDVRGISISYGNTVVENAYRNAVEIVRRVGKRTKLAVGARRPLRRPLAVARETHGESGLGYAELAPPGVIFGFVKSLERLLAEQPEPITLVTLGPLTSLALALHSDPELVRAKVSQHLAMAGNIGAAGNTTRFSEFNAWCDPEALDVVLRAELPTDLVSLDVTRQMVLGGGEVTRLAQAGTPQANWIRDALRFYIEFHWQYERLDGCVVNDVLPVGALIQPGALVFEERRMVVDLEDGEHRGHTRVDPTGARVRLATAVKTGLVRALLSERVFRWAASSPVTPAPHAGAGAGATA